LSIRDTSWRCSSAIVAESPDSTARSSAEMGLDGALEATVLEPLALGPLDALSL
jgi:hypothetical protein